MRKLWPWILMFVGLLCLTKASLMMVQDWKEYKMTTGVK